MIGDYRLDPPADPPLRECDDCGQWMQWEPDGDEDGPFLFFWCDCDAA